MVVIGEGNFNPYYYEYHKKPGEEEHSFPASNSYHCLAHNRSRNGECGKIRTRCLQAGKLSTTP